MPDWRRDVRGALASLNLDPGREQAIVEELAQHASERFDELRSLGLAAAEAQRRVLEELGPDRLSAELRPVFRSAPPSHPLGALDREKFLSGLGRDLRLAARLLRLNPVFACVAILSLALGVGANTAIFQLIDAVVLRTLPVRAPQQLANIDLVHEGRIGTTVARQKTFSTAQWEQLRQHQQAFSSIAAWSTEQFDLGNGGEAHYANGMWVSGAFFGVLEMTPALGRLFAPSDDYTGCGVQGAVLSYAFWQRSFGGRADAIGSKISIDQHPLQIIGVTPATFAGLEVGRSFDVALPLCSEPVLHADAPWTNSPITWWLDAIGRLAPGWTFDRASADLAAISPGIFAATLPSQYDALARKDYLRFSMRALPAATGESPLRKAYEEPLWLLLAISALVLLIACANLANLMLARAGVRQREMALRVSLGASRARLIRQLLVESLLLAFLGAAVGAALAQVLGRALIAGISTGNNSVFLSLTPDGRVLAFTAGLALFTCLLFGIAPALQASRAQPASVLRSSGRGQAGGRDRFALRRSLIVSQVALSLVLVATALLFVRTFQNLVSVNPGFQPRQILVADFDFSSLKLPVERRLAYKRELLRQVSATPGVIAAAQTNIVPLSGNGWNEYIDVPSTEVRRRLSNFSEVTSEYFRTLEIPLIAGRTFTDSDTITAPRVALVNQAFAKAFLGAGNPIGRTFGVQQDGGKPDNVYQVIGLVGDTKYFSLREHLSPLVFVDQDQDVQPDLDSTFVIRSGDSVPALIGSLKNTAANLSPGIVLQFSELRGSILESIGRERLMASLSGFYGVLAALLATVGLYGIMSWMVIRRRSEIGVRMALGATRARILFMMMREALMLLAIGLAAGILLVVAAGRAVQTLLFGLKPTDPVVLLVAMAGMTAITMIASLLPAERAAAVQPMQTLREE